MALKETKLMRYIIGVDLGGTQLRAALSDPELTRRYTELGLEPQPSTPDEISTRLRGEIDKWSHVIRDAGIEQQ